MTDRLKGVYVAFETDIREDDAESLLRLLRHIRGVIAVEPSVADVSDWIARERARREIGMALWAVLYPKKEGA